MFKQYAFLSLNTGSIPLNPKPWDSMNIAFLLSAKQTMTKTISAIRVIIFVHCANKMYLSQMNTFVCSIVVTFTIGFA